MAVSAAAGQMPRASAPGAPLSSNARSLVIRLRIDNATQNLLSPAVAACGPANAADPAAQNSLLACHCSTERVNSLGVAFVAMRWIAWSTASAGPTRIALWEAVAAFQPAPSGGA